MNREEMIDELHGHGVDAGVHFNDGLYPQCGWFGWTVVEGILTIHFTNSESVYTCAQWRLTPVEREES